MEIKYGPNKEYVEEVGEEDLEAAVELHDKIVNPIEKHYKAWKKDTQCNECSDLSGLGNQDNVCMLCEDVFAAGFVEGQQYSREIRERAIKALNPRYDTVMHLSAAITKAVTILKELK